MKDGIRYAIFLIDRRALGANLKAINRRYPAVKATMNPEHVKTFKNKKLAKAFLKKKVERDIRYRYMVEKV
jgi:D-serine deaminase-like pyridoxal phosphate-dependent protein